MNSRFLTMTLFPVVGLMLAAAGPAGAQSRVFGNAPAAYGRDDYRTPYADAQRAAFDNGYRDGRKRGEQAAHDNRPFDVQRERDYRNAEDGYNRSLGDRNRYRDNYRGGFTQGYREGYQRRDSRGSYPGSGGDENRGRGYGGNGGYGNSGGYGNNSGYGNNGGYGGTASYGAYQNGAGDGYKKGLDDVNDRKRPDVTRQKWYRSGDHDYDSRYGAKETYRVEYRRGFEEGYNRAYRERRY
jgi:hypothetical protein